MVKSKIFCIHVFIVILCVSFTGCGYTTSVTLPNGVSSIYVPNFTNQIPPSRQSSYESGLEIDVTNGIIDYLLYDGNLKVASAKDADAILEGVVTGYHQEAVRYSSVEGVSEYRLFIIVSLVFKMRETGEVLWTEGSFTGSTEYFIEGASAISERAAADDAIEDLASKIVDRIVEDW